VQRGNISVDITAVGNLSLSQTDDLAFEVPGTVEDVSVQAGDTVKKGQVLVTLDTTQWDAQVTSLERAVTSANRTVTAKQKALRDAQNAVIAAQNQVTSMQYALTQAQYDLRSAQNALNQITDVKRVQDQIDDAQQTIDIAKGVLSGNFTIGMAPGVDNYWTNVIQAAQASIVQLNQQKKDILAGTSLTISSDVALQIANAQLNVQQKQLGIDKAQLNLTNAHNALIDANGAIAPAQEDIKNAQDDLKTARDNLADARSKSPQIVAPFGGFVTAVPVEGGDDVKKGTVAVTVSDPTRFEAELMVNETDISKVRLGAAATIVPQAASGATYSANVTRIAPTATIQQGVVNYKVTVEVGAPVLASARRGQTGTGEISSGNGSLRQQFTSGNLTQDQVNQIIQQRQQAAGGLPGQPPGGGGFFSGAAPTQEQINQFIQQRQATGGQSRQFQSSASSATSLNLAAGMTVTVTIPVESRINVLLVPNGAITTGGGQATVTVVTSGNVTESRAIQTGISDSQNTEVTGGLTLGEKIQITTRTTTSTNANRTGIPGLGGGGGVFIGR